MSCSSSNTFRLPCGGTTTLTPLSTHPPSTLNSVCLLKYRRMLLSVTDDGHPLSTQFFYLGQDWVLVCPPFNHVSCNWSIIQLFKKENCICRHWDVCWSVRKRQSTESICITITFTWFIFDTVCCKLRVSMPNFAGVMKLMWNSLCGVKQIWQGLVVRIYDKFTAIQILMEPFQAKYYSQCLLVYVGIPLFCRSHGAWGICNGTFWVALNLCESTAPTP